MGFDINGPPEKFDIQGGGIGHYHICHDCSKMLSCNSSPNSAANDCMVLLSHCDKCSDTTWYPAIIEKRGNSIFIHDGNVGKLGGVLIRIQPNDTYDDGIAERQHLAKCDRCDEGDMCEGFIESLTWPTAEIFDDRLHLMANDKV